MCLVSSRRSHKPIYQMANGKTDNKWRQQRPLTTIMLLTTWLTSKFCDLSCIPLIKMFLAKLSDSFFPNFRADVVNILRNFEQFLNQISFTWKDGFTTESKLKMIYIHHQNHPSKTICQRMIIFPEVIEKRVAGKYTSLQQKLVNRKI